MQVNALLQQKQKRQSNIYAINKTNYKNYTSYYEAVGINQDVRNR